MAEYRIPEDTKIGWVRLRVSNLERATHFYGSVVGLRCSSKMNTSINGGNQITAGFSPSGDPPYVVLLEEDPHARRKPPHTSGLYHTAIRFPSRPALGQVLQRIVLHDYPLGGVADHGVSEALYLSDPDGNGVELYADRPQEMWPHENGRINMVTETLDLNSLIREAEAAQKEDFAPAETDIGHVHLQVADLDRAKDFYHGLLGLDITQDSYPGALFLSAGGYHHHVGLNIWAGRGVPPPPPDALGLTAFSLLLPDQASMQNLIERIQAASITTESETIPKMGLFHLLDDPDGIGVALSIN